MAARKNRRVERANDDAVALSAGSYVSGNHRRNQFAHINASGHCAAPHLSIFSVVAGWKLRSTLNEYRRCRLGFSGERAVGHHLNQLAADGYRVYHDLQFGGFNIDHVLIGPSGVYAIETKTFKKGKGKTSHIVDYDGKKIICREWQDARPVEQALRNAKHLSMWLGQSVGQPVWVVPVLTLPGWWVNQTGEGGVTVLNSKQVGGFVSGRPSILSAASIARISHQVEQKCLLY